MKKLISLIVFLFITLTSYAQITDKDTVAIHDKNYKKVKTVRLDSVFPTVERLYQSNKKFYNGFYLIDSKDTLYIQRKEEHIKIIRVKQ